MTQFGFFFDQSRCTGCHACSIICKSWNELSPGPVKWMRVFQWEKGSFPDVRVHTLAIPCFHCEEPACLRACPGRAIHKEDRFGAVLVDARACEEVHRKMDCRRCWRACSFGAPQFPSDDPRSTMSMCTMCIDRLYEGQKPICVLSCSLRALDFDTLDNLRKWYGQGDILEDLPKTAKSRPAVVLKRHDAKRQIVPWNADEALRVWQQRGPYAQASLPRIFGADSDVGTPAPAIVGRSKLILKPQTVESLMISTRDDE